MSSNDVLKSHVNGQLQQGVVSEVLDELNDETWRWKTEAMAELDALYKRAKQESRVSVKLEEKLAFLKIARGALAARRAVACCFGEHLP